MGLQEYRDLANDREAWEAWMAKAVELRELRKGERFRTVSNDVHEVTEAGDPVTWACTIGDEEPSPFGSSTMVQRV